MAITEEEGARAKAKVETLEEFDTLQLRRVEVEITVKYLVPVMVFETDVETAKVTGVKEAELDLDKEDYTIINKRAISALQVSSPYDVPKGWEEADPYGPSTGYFNGWEFNIPEILAGEARFDIGHTFDDDVCGRG